MKKIYIFAAVLALLTLSLNAQNSTKDHLVKQTSTTEKQVDMPQLGFKKALNLGVKHAPNHAPQRANRGTMTWSWVGANNGTTLPTGWTMTDPDHSALNDNGDGTWYIGVSNDGSATAQSITIPASVFAGCENVTVVIRAKIDTGASGKSISVNGSSKSLTNTLTDYTWENISTTNGVLIEPTDGYVGFASIIITGEIDSNDETICDGTDTNGYLPIYGFYYDENQINQMIYPSSLLTNLNGKKITSMKFYSPHLYFSGGVFTVKMGTTSQASFSSAVRNTADLTATVVTGMAAPTAGGTELTITFNTPFEYNGGNLLVDFQVTTPGSYGSSQTSFYGITQTGGGFYSYGSSINSTTGVYSTKSQVQNFLPKVTFAVEESGPKHDLGIALSAPASIGAGKTATVTATVTNNGDFDEANYTVTIYANGTAISTQNVNNETLLIGGTRIFTANYATTDAQVGTTVNFTATVTCTDDADASNNNASASMSVITLPPPENVVATAGENQTATVTWDLPIIATIPTTLTWDFEEQSDFNDFTTIDADGDGYNWAWHLNESSGSNLTTNSGNGVIYSESYHKTTSSGTALHPNNWLISPEVTLGGTLEFYACGQDPNQYWNEVFGVYVCVGSYNGVSDFVQVGADVTTTHDMTKYSYNLSQYQGQGYFAIVHHNVTDEFYLNVDDITYTYAAGNYPISYNVYLDGVLQGNVNSSTFSYDFSNLADGEHTCAVSAVYSYGESVAVPATFTITSLPTPNAPTVNSTNGTTSTTITITPDPVTDGNLVYYVEYNGQQTQDLTFPRGATEYVVYVHAHTTATANYNESPEAVVPVTIPALPQTEAPVISYETVGDNVVITATGNGTVTLNIPGYPEATGTGSASITVPRHMEDYTVTATATAQEADHLASETTTEQVPISGLVNDGDWLQMDGSYTTGSQQLTFTRGNNPILFVDQFTAETQNNEHPDRYDYCLSEDVENDAKTSSTIPIPVHKTYSTLQGLYTKAEVDNDALNTPRELTANAVNGTMAYDIKAGSEVYFYGLYRGALDANPVIDESHRISMIQKDLNEAFFNENMTNDVEPKYSHIDAGDIKRVDKGYVTGNNSNTMAYVPVIWTYGDHTGRPAATGNNSYGSDIKRMKIGDVTARIEGTKSDGNSWGKWKVGETEYCVYTPVISITGIMPVDIPQGDGDYATYEPYMFRAWCTYDKAYDFGHDSDGHLVGGDLIPAPFLLDSVLLEPNQKEYVLGGEWNGETRMPWAFGVEVGENPTNITFLIRFYYKKVVTNAQQSNKLMGNRDGEGAEEYFAVECEGDAQGIVTAINEILNGRIPIETTYVNAQGMTSNKPFDGLNIVVTRYSDGSTTTTKVVR